MNVLGEFISQALATGLLRCNPESGTVYNRRSEVKCQSKAGYIVGTVHLSGVRKQVKAHQVVWISVNGSIPSGLMLDHIDRVKTNNAISNLRLATPAENSANRRSYKGAGCPSAKINQEIAEEIRLHHSQSKSYFKTATQFRVSRTLVACIVRRELWN